MRKLAVALAFVSLVALALPARAEGGSWTRVVGTSGDDHIHTGDGHQRIYAKGGDDVVGSGFDADVEHGGPGNDRLWSGPDDDEGELVYGGLGNDRLHDNDGRDPSEGAVLDGGPGFDHCSGYRSATTFTNCEVVRYVG